MKKDSSLLSNSDESSTLECSSWEEFVGKDDSSEGEDEEGSRDKKC